MRNRIFKRTKGFQGEILVAKGVAYTDDADYKTFVTTAVDGEIGIFDATTHARIGPNAAIVDGTRIYIAQKRNGDTKLSLPFDFYKKNVKFIGYTAPVKQVSTVTIAGVIGTAFKIGDSISVRVIEITPGSMPWPTKQYDYTIKAGDTPTTIATALTASINSTGIPNDQGDAFVTATSAAGVITITAMYFQSMFKTSVLGSTFATVAESTVAYVEGSGYSDRVAEIEVEGLIYEGVTTQYPDNGFSPDDFGSPNKFVVSGQSYNLYQLSFYREQSSPTPLKSNKNLWTLQLYIPSSGTTPDVAVSKAFGFTATT